MSTNAPRTKGLECSKNNRALIFEIDVLRDLIDPSEDTLLCVYEDYMNSQPLIMVSDFEVDQTTTPMASESKSEDFMKVIIRALLTCLL
jgi:hypothetical protein